MSDRLHLEYFLLRYVPAITEDAFVTIGIIMFIREVPDFAAVKFLESWTPVISFDPDADLDYLKKFAEDIEAQVRNDGYRKQILERMKDSFSNIIQLSEAKECLAEDPVAEFRALCALHLRVKI